jgi:2-phosphoglycerate kinase
MAQVLADEYELHTYHCDEAFAEHRQQVTASRQPMLHKWTHTAWDELWMQPREILVAEAIACYQEHFQLVVKDLLARPQSERVLAEGTCLLPGSVGKVLSSKDRAIWVIPTERFQKAHYRGRGAWVEGILSECTRPEVAFQNWMDRDAKFARWVAQRANELGLRIVQVDGRQTIAENVRLIAALLRL